MREIKCEDIIQTVKKLCIDAACDLPGDVFRALVDKKMKNLIHLLKRQLMF